MDCADGCGKSFVVDEGPRWSASTTLFAFDVIKLSSNFLQWHPQRSLSSRQGGASQDLVVHTTGTVYLAYARERLTLVKLHDDPRKVYKRRISTVCCEVGNGATLEGYI